MKEKYEQHTAEKQKVRALKNESKEAAKVDKTKAVLIFDLQQVIYLPRTNESAVFYMRRLSIFNFTVYDITTKECFCYTWDETIAKRGACEIASCLKKLLQEYDNKVLRQSNSILMDALVKIKIVLWLPCSFIS